MSTCCETGFLKVVKSVTNAEKLGKLKSFDPPKKKTYEIKDYFNSTQKSNGLQKTEFYKKVTFCLKDIQQNIYPWINTDSYIVKNHLTKKHLVIIHFKNKNKTEFSKYIVYSHDNSSDLGTIYPILIDFSTQLKTDIIAYDYTGYGESRGTPCENVITEDLKAVLDLMTTVLNIPLNKITLFGHLIGSYPSVNLASCKEYRGINSLILLNPVLSLKKFENKSYSLNRTGEIGKTDIFGNFDKISEINCPIFLIHGYKDRLIPVKDIIKMAKSIKTLYQWFPSKGDNSNILTKYRRKFYTKCKMFFDYMNIFRKKSKQIINNSEVLKNYSFKYEESYMVSDTNKPFKRINPDITPLSDLSDNNAFSKSGTSKKTIKSYGFLTNSTSPFIKIAAGICCGENYDFSIKEEKNSLCGNYQNINEIEEDFIKFKLKNKDID